MATYRKADSTGNCHIYIQRVGGYRKLGYRRPLQITVVALQLRSCNSHPAVNQAIYQTHNDKDFHKDALIHLLFVSLAVLLKVQLVRHPGKMTVLQLHPTLYYQH